jgi:hypothetical protein
MAMMCMTSLQISKHAHIAWETVMMFSSYLINFFVKEATRAYIEMNCIFFSSRALDITQRKSMLTKMFTQIIHQIGK